MNFVAPATISFWMKSGYDPGNQAERVYSISQGGATSNYFYITLGKPSASGLSNQLVCIASTVGGTNSACYTTSDRNQLFNNEWHQVAIVTDGSEWKLYIDNTEKTLSDDLGSGNIGTYGAVSFANNIKIGSYYGNTNSDFYLGMLDHFSIFNYARTPAQIAWDYNGGKPIAEWRFDECSGGIIHDESGNGYDGTLNLGVTGIITVGTCASSSNSFWYLGKNGAYKAAGSFDGASDYIDIGDTNLNIESIGFWIFPHNTTNYVIDLDGGTHTVALANGRISANGFADPQIYVNGKSGRSITRMAWQHVLITTDTAFEASNLRLGRIGGNYYDGLIDDVRFFNYPLTPEQIKTEYTGGAMRIGGVPSQTVVTAGTCTQRFSDDFNRPDNDNIGPDWIENGSGNLKIASNVLRFDKDADYEWGSADSVSELMSDTQYAKFTITDFGGYVLPNSAELILRSGAVQYLIYISRDSSDNIYWKDNVGDIQGTTISVDNGVSVAAMVRGAGDDTNVSIWLDMTENTPFSSGALCLDTGKPCWDSASDAPDIYFTNNPVNAADDGKNFGIGVWETYGVLGNNIDIDDYFAGDCE